jgi:GDP-L-fucose synthase
MVRKIHLSKCLEDNNWDAIRKDLNRRPVEGVNGKADEKAILEILAKYGINTEQTATEISPSQSLTVPPSHRLKVALNLWGTGRPMREFLWSEDMADACVFIMENRNFEDVKAECDREVINTHINIGTGKEISIRELSEVIQKEIGFQGTIRFDSTKPDGTMRKLTDPSKLHRLGWKHNIELEEGIKLMYQHYLKV